MPLLEPPPIPGVTRRRVSARGIDFHVTEAGEGGGTTVLALHGWPQHHYCYRDLLASPPEGVRLIAPDLPGYGWSGPAPHRWRKQEVAADVLALLDAMEIERVVLVGHDWGCFIGYLLVLGAPERFDGFVAMSVPHVWVPPGTLLRHGWRLGHMPPMAAAGSLLMRRTPFLERAVFRLGIANRAAFGADEVRWYAERFRDPVCARTSQDTYRTFLTRELPHLARNPERRRATVPVRALVGERDFAVHPALLSPGTALADDYSVGVVPGAGHFLPDEAPDAVRARVVELAGLTSSSRSG